MMHLASERRRIAPGDIDGTHGTGRGPAARASPLSRLMRSAHETPRSCCSRAALVLLLGCAASGPWRHHPGGAGVAGARLFARHHRVRRALSSSARLLSPTRRAWRWTSRASTSTRRSGNWWPRSSPDDPNIAGIRVGQFTPGVVRLVMDLKQAIAPQVFTLTPVAAYQHRLVFDLYPTQVATRWRP